MKPKTCKRCGQPIRWVATVAGRPVALTGTPCPDGPVCLERTGAGLLVARRAAEQHTGPRYRVHRAVCPAGRAS
jgi:hypothetical protein